MSRDSLSKTEIYAANLFAKEDMVLQRVREKLINDGKFGINVGAQEGKLLQVLVGLISPKLIVEIGALYGYSTVWLARALPTGGRLISLEKDSNNFKVAKNLIAESDVRDKVEIRNGDALELMKQITESPDVIFIDADKGNYRHYLDWAMKAVRVGGLVIGDNTLLFGHMIGEDRGENTSAKAIESMKYFNETLAMAKNFRAALIPTYEGITIAQRIS